MQSQKTVLRKEDSIQKIFQPRSPFLPKWPPAPLECCAVKAKRKRPRISVWGDRRKTQCPFFPELAGSTRFCDALHALKKLEPLRLRVSGCGPLPIPRRVFSFTRDRPRPAHFLHGSQIRLRRRRKRVHVPWKIYPIASVLSENCGSIFENSCLNFLKF